MTNFTQALVRIEVLDKEPGSASIFYNPEAEKELRDLLYEHASDIVQLARVAQGMADRSETLTQLIQDYDFAQGAEKRRIMAAIYEAQRDMVDAWAEHFKLMKEEKK